MNKLTYLKDLAEIGVSYVVSFPAPGGCQTLFLSPEQIISYSENPDLYIAGVYGVSLSDYLNCKEEEFSVRCSAKTSKGKRCKNIVTGGSMVLPNKWAELTGNYCEVHEHGKT